MNFLRSILSDASTGEGSTKRTLYFGVVITLCLALFTTLGILIAFTFLQPVTPELTKQFLDFFISVADSALLATTTGYVGGKFVETKKSESE